MEGKKNGVIFEHPFSVDDVVQCARSKDKYVDDENLGISSSDLLAKFVSSARQGCRA